MSSENLFRTRQKERELLLERITILLEADKPVTAAWLFGSLRNGTADSLSDIDLWVVVSDEYIEEIIANRREYVAQVGKLLLIQEAPQNAPAGGAYLLTLYSGDAGPQHVDWYWQPQSLAKKPPATSLLFDHVGIPNVEPTAPLTSEERLRLAPNQIAFFWAMSIVTAKRIARRQSWSALTMLGMLTYTIEEIKWLVNLREEQPNYKDTRTEVPPAKPEEQMAMLREMAGEMNMLTYNIKELSETVSPEAIRQVYSFFDSVEIIIAHTADKV